MIIGIIIEMHCKRLLQMHDAFYKTLFNTPNRGVYFEHAQNKRRRMAFYAIAQRAHSVAGDCTARTSAIRSFL